MRERWLLLHPHEAHLAGWSDTEQLSSRGPQIRTQADENARRAAQIYSDAVAAGNSAPAVAVAVIMDRSRSQVARYIRRARELELLPPLDVIKGN